MSKGLKRICMNCGARFYDLDKSPIICPSCDTEFTGEVKVKTRRGRIAALEEAPAKEVEAAPVATEGDDDEDEIADIDADDDIVSLDDVDEDDNDDDDEEAQLTIDSDLDDLVDDDEDDDVIEDDEEDDKKG